MLEHGGRLRQAAAHWGIPLETWLDLSTGINPWGYPVPTLAAATWQRLPEDEDGLQEAAVEYYGNTNILPLPGSQAAIQALPRLLPPGRAAVLAPSYREHAAAWQRAGWDVLPFAPEQLEQAATQANAVVLCNPNNPTGDAFTARRLRAVARELAKHGGLLVVDEAFGDADNRNSLADLAGTPRARNLVVLRSLGKFFGLAGARVGFALARPELLTALGETLGPWALSGPSRVVAKAALENRPWQEETLEELMAASARLERLLQDILGRNDGTALFRWLPHPWAPTLHEKLAQRGILTRLITDPSGLRIGLPAREAHWQRLTTALTEIAHELDL